MKIPLSWLNEYVEVKDLAIGTLRERLDLAGLEIEGVEAIGYPEAELPWDPDKVITGEVVAVYPHPNADRLVLAEVNYGGTQTEVVVTGAPSLYALKGEQGLSLKVAFAWHGAVLYDGHREGWIKARLKQTKIRGEPSRAMVCSEKELGLSEEAEDILYLPDDTPVGVPLVDVLGDYVLNFDIKGPFGHLQSVFGIAREVAALFNRPLRRTPMEAVDRLGLKPVPRADFIDVEIADPDLCSRYTATLIRQVEVGPSPLWMQMRLRRAGMRPINNIVDITNYVMLELGQPLHAFDYAVLRPREGEAIPAIIVRRAKPGEQMTTLDGELRTFDSEMLLITDGRGPIGIAGVMGGQESEVVDATQDVLLEAANFDFLNIRRTSQRLRLHTEASARFGKRVDPEIALIAAARAAELMVTLAGGTVEPAVADIYPGRPERSVLSYRPSEATRLLGVEIPPEEQKRIFEALEFEVESEQIPWSVTAPTYRQDVRREADLVEEVARIWGYDRFPVTLIDEPLPPLRRNRPLEWEERLRDILVGLGLDEVITYSLIDPQDEERLHPKAGEALTLPGEPVRLQNYLSPERSQMRRTLLPGALRTAWSNLRYLDRIAIFEIGRIYFKSGAPDAQTGETGVAEPRHLSVLLTGVRRPRWWQEEPQATGPMDYFDLKGIVDALLTRLDLAERVDWARGSHPSFHPGRCAQVALDGQVLGVVGELHPLVCEAFDLPANPVLALEWDLEVLRPAAERAAAEKTVGRLSPYAPVREDLALVVDETTPALAVQRAILEGGRPLVTQAVLFDVYRGEQVGEGKKSLAFALTYQAPNRSLSERDVSKLRKRILKYVERQVGARLRGA